LNDDVLTHDDVGDLLLYNCSLLVGGIPHYRHFTVRAYLEHITPSDRSILVLHLLGPVLIKRLSLSCELVQEISKLECAEREVNLPFKRIRLFCNSHVLSKIQGVKPLKDCLLMITLIVLTFGGVTYIFRFAFLLAILLTFETRQPLIVAKQHLVSSRDVLFKILFWIKLCEIPFQRILEGIREPSKYSIRLPIIENH
jgi:hypothetical protein